MNHPSNLTKDNFELLLRWLDHDRETAASKYENIRETLIKIFRWQRCSGAEDLADETINRTAGHIRELGKVYKGDPARYFYGVANNICREYHRSESQRESLEDRILSAELSNRFEDLEDDYLDEILTHCLKHLRDEDRSLLLAYYSFDTDVAANRKKVAKEFGLKPSALRKRVQRLRGILHEWMEELLKAEGFQRRK